MIINLLSKSIYYYFKIIIIIIIAPCWSWYQDAKPVHLNDKTVIVVKNRISAQGRVEGVFLDKTNIISMLYKVLKCKTVTEHPSALWWMRATAPPTQVHEYVAARHLLCALSFTQDRCTCKHGALKGTRNRLMGILEPPPPHTHTHTHTTHTHTHTHTHTSCSKCLPLIGGIAVDAGATGEIRDIPVVVVCNLK